MFPKSIGDAVFEEVNDRGTERGGIPERYLQIGKRIQESEEKTSTAVDQSPTAVGVIYEESKLEIGDVVTQE